MNDLPELMTKVSLAEDNLVRVEKIHDRVRVCIRDDEDMSPNLTNWFHSLCDVHRIEINVDKSKCITIIEKVLMGLADKADMHEISLLYKTPLNSDA